MSRAFRKLQNYFIAGILGTATERHELLHISTSEEKADTKLILHAHQISKAGYCKVAIHSPSVDTDISLL